jgi:hypothetical protein
MVNLYFTLLSRAALTLWGKARELGIYNARRSAPRNFRKKKFVIKL